MKLPDRGAREFYPFRRQLGDFVMSRDVLTRRIDW